VTDLERFMEKVEKTPGVCWQWMGYRNQDGYGHFNDHSGEGGTYKTVRAHRFAYQCFVGPIPDELTLDHLCRNPGCVNPAHLEPVTNKENILRGEGLSAKNARKTHCLHGHEYDDENTGTWGGGRHCRACERERHRAFRRRKQRAAHM